MFYENLKHTDDTLFASNIAYYFENRKLCVMNLTHEEVRNTRGAHSYNKKKLIFDIDFCPTTAAERKTGDKINYK